VTVEQEMVCRERQPCDQGNGPATMATTA